MMTMAGVGALGSGGRSKGLLPSSTGRRMFVMLVLVISVAATAAAQVSTDNNNNSHQLLLRHDESTRFDEVAAPTEVEDRELLGELKLDIFSHRKGGGGSKSSKGSNSEKFSSKSSSKKKPKKKKKKRHQRRKKKKKKSDSKSKSKSKAKKSGDDDDDDKLVKLSIKGSYSSGESNTKKKSDTKSKSSKKKSSGGSKHDDADDDDKSDKKKSSPSKSADNKNNKKKSSLSKTDVDPSKRLCNTSKERQCRDDCFKSNKCQKGHVLSPCHKKCRYKCCDPDSKYESTKKGTNAGELCNTSEEKLCRVKCFEKKGCGEHDEDCQKDCRQDCCSVSKDDKSKSKDDKDSDSDSSDRHSKKNSGKDADDGKDKDKDKNKSKSYKPLKWGGDDIPSECQEDVDKFNSCYEKQYEDGKECYGYNAARELDEIFEAVTNSDGRKRDYETCGDWYDFVCPIRAETDCCRNRIRAIGRCLGREVFDVGGDGCDDTCRGYDDDDKEAVGNVFDPDTFSTLVGLLTDYYLVGVLSGDDPITVLAPTNDAFEEFISGLPDEGDLSLESLTDSGLLEEVLKYHVLVGDFSYDELQDGGRFETAQGERVKVSSDEEDDYDDLYALTVDGEKYVGRYDRSCRVDGGKGDFDKDEDVTLAECQEKCTEDKDCVGYEYKSDEDACEYHRESGLKYLDEDEGAFSVDDEDDVECFWKRSSGNDGDVILNDDAMIIPDMADIEGSNGYVHAIDKVLLPPSIVNVDRNLYEVASADSDFSTAAEILAQFELDEFFEGRGPFTLFLPTNQAFEDLLEALPDDGPFSFDGLVDSGDLLEIVKYHIIQGAQVLSSEIFNGDRFRSVQGERMQVTIDGDFNVLINRDAKVVLPDIIGKNGVIHGIDQVLIPPSIVEATRGDDYNPLDWPNADVPRDCRDLVDEFNTCYENNAGVGGTCFDFDASRALDDLRDISNRADRDYRQCEDWFGLVCTAREDADGCCSSEIRDLGNCLGEDVWGHKEDKCDDFECDVDDGTDEVGESFNPLDTDDAPRSCRSEVQNFNDCYEQNSDRRSCRDFDAAREMRDLFEITGDGPDFIFYDDCVDYYKLACSFREGVSCCVEEIEEIETCLGETAYGFRETQQFRDGGCDLTCNVDGTIDDPDGGSSSEPELFTGSLNVPFRFNINTSPRITGNDIMRARGNTIKDDVEGGLALLVPEVVDDTFDSFRLRRLVQGHRKLPVRYRERDLPEIIDVIDITCPLGVSTGVGCRKIEAEVTLQVEDENETQVRRQFSQAMADAVTDGRLESKIKQFNPDYNKEPEKVEPDEVKKSNTGDDGLTTAQIAGIAVGAFAGVLLLGLLAGTLAKNRKSSHDTNYEPSESQYASQGYADERYGGDQGYEESAHQYADMPGPETQALTSIDEGGYADEYHDEQQVGGEEIQYEQGGYEDGVEEYHDGGGDRYGEEGQYQEDQFDEGGYGEEADYR